MLATASSRPTLCESIRVHARAARLLSARNASVEERIHRAAAATAGRSQPRDLIRVPMRCVSNPPVNASTSAYAAVAAASAKISLAAPLPLFTNGSSLAAVIRPCGAPVGGRRPGKRHLNVAGRGLI